MIRSAPEPVKPVRVVAPPVAVPVPTTINIPPLNGKSETLVARPPAPRLSTVTAPPVALQSIDDDLAAAIDAEIGNLVSGHQAKPAATKANASPLPAVTQTAREAATGSAQSCKGQR